MLKTATLLALLLPVTLAFGQADKQQTRLANSIAAIVESKIITIEDVRRELQPYLAQIQADAEGDPLKFRKLLEEAETEIIQNLTDDVLIVKSFYDDKGQIPKSYVDNEVEEQIITRFDGKRSLYLDYLKSIGKTPEEHRVTIMEGIVVSYMRSKMRKEATIVSPVKIESFYTENKESFFEEEAIHLRLIRLEKMTDEDDGVLNQTAQEILKKIEMGFAFDELAIKYSNDSKSKKGGDWGWVTQGSLVDELGNVAFSLEEGEHSDPISLGKNLFIIYIEERNPEGYLALPDVREDIEDMLLSQMAREAEDRFLERLRRDGYVRRFN